MSLSKLSKLPPEVLSSVLNNEAIPLSRRLHLRLLCNLWADIIEDGLKKVTSLVVRDEEPDYLKPKPDDLVLKFPAPTDEFTRPLSRLFTSLTKLSIDFDDSWNAVHSLLAHLDTANLTAVKLHGNYCKQVEGIAIAAALTALSGLTSLTMVGYFISSALLPHLKPVLSRLEKFCYLTNSWDSGDSDGIISSSLSPRCTHLWFHSYHFQSIASSLLVELSRNLTHLHLFDCANTIWQFISQLHKLNSLALHFTRNPDLDSSFFSNLAPFTGLTQVKLYGLSYRAPLALPSKKETLMSSIKRLTLEVNFGDSPVDYQAIFQAVSIWFPNLVKLSIVTLSDAIPDIQASLGKLPFSVEIGDDNSADTFLADW